MLRYRMPLHSMILILTLALAGCAGDGANVDLDDAAKASRPFSIKSGEISYSSSVGTHNAYLCRPATSDPVPAIVVIHEWWGLNEHIKSEAERLARLGYVTLAVDLYNGRVATSPADAAALKGEVDDAAAVATMRGAVDFLAKLPQTKGQPIGCIGWCFGGTKSLQLAIAEPRIDACVLYYGTPITDPEELGRIQGRVLGIFGEADSHIPLKEVDALADGLALSGVPYRIETFPDVGHAFANPSNQGGYAPKAAEDARRISDEFLKETLR
ncbi:dienelactone hydrolase family protein [bacterium]|nr:dienelactone hydrolase family protein [bacterium]